MSRFAPGQLVSDKFRVLSVLGEGAMGTVYAAQHLTLRVNIALKVLSPQLARRPDQVERFLREGVAISRVRHRAVVQVYDAGKHDAQPWIAMELLEGETLRARMTRQPPSAKEVSALMIEVLAGLSVAHAQGIVHRDVKPTNIFLAHQPDGTVQPKLLDFGIALVMDVQERLTGAGMTMGTLSYMAPEQIHAARDVDARADLYAIGAILYEALSGRPPYRAGSVHELVAAVASQPPPDLTAVAPHQPKVMAEIVNRCLAVERDRRPQDARQLGAMLDAALRFADQPANVPATLRIPGVDQQQPKVDPMAHTSPGGYPAGGSQPGQAWAQPSAGGSQPGWPATATPPQGGAWAQPSPAHPHVPTPPQAGAWAQPHPSHGGAWAQGPASWQSTPGAGSHPGGNVWPGPAGSYPGSNPGSYPGSHPGYQDPSALFPQAPPRSPMWHLAWILPVGLLLMAGTGFAVVKLLDDDDEPGRASTAAVAADPTTPAPTPSEPAPPVADTSAGVMVPIEAQPAGAEPTPVPVPQAPEPAPYPTLAPTPVPTPTAHACVGVWSGPLLQSDGQRGSGVVTIRGSSGSCGGFVERWASGSRCDYRLSGCGTDGNVLTASARTPSHQACSPVRMRFTCEGRRMRFHEAAGRVTVTSSMSPRSSR